MIILPESEKINLTMTYPNTRITKPVRRAIMIGLILLFFIISPLVILYTAGYRYNIAARRVEQTGVISIDVGPKKANVFLNGTQIEPGEKMPFRLSNYAPGTYQLRIEHEGYLPWQKDIRVRSKETTYIKDLSLFLDTQPAPLLSESDPAGAIVFASPSPGGEHALVLFSRDDLHELFLIDTRKGNRTLIRRMPKTIQPAVFWSPFRNIFLVRTPQENGTHLLAVYDARDEEPIATYEAAAPISEDRMQWNNGIAPALFFASDDRIVAFGRTGAVALPAPSSTPAAWFVQGNTVWFFPQDAPATLFRQTVGSESSELVGTFLEPITHIIDANNDRVIVRMKESGIGIIRLAEFVPDRPLTDAAVDRLQGESIAFGAHDNSWLAWSPWEVWKIFENGQRELIIRTGEKILHARAFNEYGEILLVVNGTLRVFHPGYYTLHDLYHTEGAILSLGADTENRRIFFTEMNNDEQVRFFVRPY